MFGRVGKDEVEPTTVGIPKGVIPFRGEFARGLALSAGVSEAGLRAELTTGCGSTPTARSKHGPQELLVTTS